MILLPFTTILSTKLIISTIGLLSICIFLKLAYSKKRLSQRLPSTQHSFLNVLGDVYEFQGNEEFHNGFSLTTHLLQYIVGKCLLFKNVPLFCTWMSYVPIIVLNTPEAVEEVLRGTNTIQKAFFYDWLHCWLGTGLLTSHGSKWKSRRKLLTPAFHFDILKDFLPIMNEKSMQLVKRLKGETTKSHTNIVPFVTLCSLDIICETTLGVDINAQGNEESEYVKAVARVSDGLTQRVLHCLSWLDFTYFLTYGRTVKRDLKLLHDFTISVIREKKQKLLENKTNENSIKPKRKPLIEVLLEHHIETNELNEEDIREEVDTFTFEGHDTTSMAMTWALYLLGTYKEVQNKVHEELDEIFGDDTDRPITQDDLKDMQYLECVIKETLRIYPSVPLIGRTNDSDMDICGYHIPKGNYLAILPYVLHRNQEVFPNPEVFDPLRFLPENSKNRHPYAYIPFSAGSRNCIGQRFALMEDKIVIANVLRHYTVESLDPRDKVPTCFEIILRPSIQVRMKVKPRKPSSL